MKKIISFLIVLALMFANISFAGEKVTAKIEWSKNVPLKDASSCEIITTEDLSRKAMTKSLSAYTVKELSALPENKKIAIRIVLPKDIKQSQIEPSIYKMISDITSKDKNIDEIILNFYSDKELVEGGISDIGHATWAYDGELGNVTPDIARSNNRSGYKITYSILGNLENYLKQRSKQESIFGYTEAQRRKIYKEIVAAEDRSTAETEKLYPTNSNNIPMNKLSTYDWKGMFEKNSNKSKELNKKYQKQIRKKYKLTEEQIDKLETEAFEEQWPLD